MALKFQKMHGAGNDFVLLDLREQHFGIDAFRAAELADRHTGIGCDQVLVLRAPTDEGCHAGFEVWNADGSRAEQCGNGVRCIGLYLHSRGESTGGEIRLQGPVSNISVFPGKNGMFRVNMGSPRFDPEAIPLDRGRQAGWYEIDVDGQPLSIGAVSMGNPHALLLVPEIDSAGVAKLGPVISRHSVFPEGCNVGFAEIVDRQSIRLRVYERGAEETRACGSGACAAVAILIKNGKLDSKVLVNQVGGVLIIEWNSDREPVMMTGPAMHLYEGALS